MLDLPQRFVPTFSRFISPVRIVPQTGHGHPITAVKCSPCLNYFVSADDHKWVKIWDLNTLEVLGIFLNDFVCTQISWDGSHAITCKNGNASRTIAISDISDIPPASQPINNTFIPLLGSPELDVQKNAFDIEFRDEKHHHPMPKLVRAQLDPCERYVIAFSPKQCLLAYVDTDDVALEVSAPENSVWLDFHIIAPGNDIVLLADNGDVFHIDPLKGKCKQTAKGKRRITSYDFGDDRHLLLGTMNGNIDCYDIDAQRVVLSTPRKPFGFNACFPSPDKVGFLALRPESATAFLENSHEILTAAPLPAPLECACPGTAYTELVAACTDHHIYRLKLDENSIVKYAATTDSVDAVAATANAVVYHETAGKFTIATANKTTTLDVSAPMPPIALALCENNTTFAALFENTLEIHTLTRTAKSASRKIPTQNAAAIAFGKEKSNVLYILMKDLRIQTLNLKNDELSELTRLPCEHAHILSVAPAAKSSLFVLVETENEHLVIYKISLTSGKSTEVLKLFTQGRQIWGASDSEQTALLRRDATCLRIIDTLKAYSIDDWTRSETLEIR